MWLRLSGVVLVQISRTFNAENDRGTRGATLVPNPFLPITATSSLLSLARWDFHISNLCIKKTPWSKPLPRLGSRLVMALSTVRAFLEALYLKVYLDTSCLSFDTH